MSQDKNKYDPRAAICVKIPKLKNQNLEGASTLGSSSDPSLFQPHKTQAPKNISVLRLD